MTSQLPNVDFHAGEPHEQSINWDGEEFIDYNAPNDVTDSSSFRLANESSDSQPNPFSYNPMPANASVPYYHHQNPQYSQSSVYPTNQFRPNSPPPEHIVPGTSASSLPNQSAIDEVSTHNSPRKKRKRGRDGQNKSVQRVSLGVERVPGPQSPEGLLVAACILYLSCNDWRKPSDIRMRYLSYLFPETTDAILHGIFDQFPNLSGNSLVHYTPTSNQTTPSSNQTTPHQVALSACEIWRHWRCRHPGERPGPDQERPSKEQLSWLADLYHENHSTLESHFKRTYRLPNGDDSGYGTLSNSVNVNETAKTLRDNHNLCVKKGEKWDKKLEGRRSKGRDPHRKYLCVECFEDFKRVSDFRRHEIARCMNEVWLCCIGGCRPDPSRYWKRKSDFRKKHVLRKHPGAGKDDLDRCHAKISENFRRSCILRKCHFEPQNFDESFKHMTKHMESPSWGLSEIRREADNTGVSKKDKISENDTSGTEYSSNDGSDDSEDGDDGPQPPNAGRSSASGRLQGGFSKSGSGYMQSQNSNSGSLNLANNSYGSSQRSSNAVILTWSRSFDFIRKSTPTLWSLGDFLRSASPSSPKLDILGQLGYGSNAVIDEIKIHGFSSTMARKTFRHILHDSERQISREVESMSKLQHPHVVELVAPYRESSSVAILMHPVADYNLSQYLATCSATPSERRNISLWFSCLSTGLEHIHEHGVRHSDIKPSNILVKGENVLFTDFGGSTTIAGVKSNRYQSPEFTKLYAAPEMLKGECRAESDIFSLGCVFLEMLTVLVSAKLWQTLRRHQQEAQESNLTHVHWAISWKRVLYKFAKLHNVQQLLDVFDGMFRLTPDERPSATEIKNRMNARTSLACEHYVHQSVQECIFHVPTRASTWPPDQASLRQHQAESNKRLRITSIDDAHVYNDTHVSRKALTVQREGLEGSTSMTIDMETALVPIHATIRPGARESKGIDFQSMMMPFLHQWDTHERFRVSGQATKAMEVKWARTYKDPKGDALYLELRKLILDLSATSSNDYGQIREAADDETESAQTDGRVDRT